MHDTVMMIVAPENPQHFCISSGRAVKSVLIIQLEFEQILNGDLSAFENVVLVEMCSSSAMSNRRYP